MIHPRWITNGKYCWQIIDGLVPVITIPWDEIADYHRTKPMLTKLLDELPIFYGCQVYDKQIKRRLFKSHGIDCYDLEMI